MRKLTLGLVGTIALAGVGCSKEPLEQVRTAAERLEVGVVDIELYSHKVNDTCFPNNPHMYLFRAMAKNNLKVEGVACCNDERQKCDSICVFTTNSDSVMDYIQCSSIYYL